MKALLFKICLIPLYLITNFVMGQENHFRQHSMPPEFGEISISTIYQSKDNFIWLGTTRGLFQFDGNEYIQYLQDTISDNAVTAIFEDNESKLWIGYNNGKIGKLTDSRFVSFQPEEGFPKVPVTGFAQDADSNIWISTYGEGAYIFSDGRLYNINMDDGLSDDFVYTIIDAPDGSMWLGTDGGIGICEFKNRKKIVRMLDTSDGLPDNIVTKLHKDSSHIWIGMESGGVARYNSKKDTFDITLPDWKFGRITELIVFDDELWAGTARKGIIRISLDPEIRHAVLENPFYRINDITADERGNIWIADGSSSIYFTNRTFTFLTSVSGKPLNNIQTVLHTENGDIWYSTETSVFLLQKTEDVFRQIDYTTKFSLRDLHVISMYEDASNNIWFGTFDAGVYYLDMGSGYIRQFTEKDGLVNNNILSIAGVGDTVWFATLGGVSRYLAGKNSSFTNYTLQNGLGSNYIYKVFVDSKKRVWFATDGEGVTKLENDLFKNYSSDEGLNSTVVYTITEDTDGKIWIGTSNSGIYFFENGRFNEYIPKNGLSEPFITSLIGDFKGNILIVSRMGIDILDLQTGSVLYHGPELGIDQIDPNLNAYSKDPDGNIWLGTQKGIIKYTPASFQQWPETRIDEIQVFLQPQEMTSAEFTHDENHISFKYHGFWYKNPSNVAYHIKLDGYDREWVKSRNNFITYPSLPPGKYNFMVKSSATGYFDQAPTQNLSFIIDPPFYNTSWFYTLGIISMAGLVAYFIKEREKKFRRVEHRKNEQVQMQFETLKSQVNPHFLFNSFNTLLAVIEEDKEAASEYVEKLSDFYRSILVYREKNVISMHEELEMIKTYYFLQIKRYRKNFTLEVNIPPHLLNKTIPPMTLQLLVENAVKHNIISKDQPLIVEIFYEDNYLIVQNNLQRRQQQEPSTGMGLANIKHRYRLLSSREVEVEETIDKYRVRIPLLPEKS